MVSNVTYFKKVLNQVKSASVMVYNKNIKSNVRLILYDSGGLENEHLWVLQDKHQKAEYRTADSKH